MSIFLSLFQVALFPENVGGLTFCDSWLCALIASRLLCTVLLGSNSLVYSSSKRPFSENDLWVLVELSDCKMHFFALRKGVKASLCMHFYMCRYQNFLLSPSILHASCTHFTAYWLSQCEAALANSSLTTLCAQWNRTATQQVRLQRCTQNCEIFKMRHF